jgi:hypothetical protein
MKKIIIGRPCCDWRRSCRAQAVTIYDVTSNTVVDEVYPVRCWRLWMEGKEPYEEVVLEFDESKHLVFYRYRTNSNRGKIIFYNIPPSLSTEKAIELIRKMYDYDKISEASIAEPTIDNTYLYSMYYYKPL